jgi:hypothetical protein
MSISTTLRTAGPFSGDDATTAFPFVFKVFESSDLLVTRTIGSAVSNLSLGSDYLVSLNTDQDSNPGGTVTLSSKLASGSTLEILSAIPATQPVQITNQGGFYPKVITNALDRLTMLVQQITAGVVSVSTVLLESLSTSTITATGTEGVKVAGVTCKDGSVGLTGSLEMTIPIAGGSANVLTATYAPAITELVDGMILMVRARYTNSSEEPTFTPNSGVISAKVIVTGDGDDLELGDVIGNGHTLMLKYDKTWGAWVLLNPGTGTGTVTVNDDSEGTTSNSFPASTSWVRNAMAAITTAAGFIHSWGSAGYIRFPTWLGSFLIQWNYVSLASLGNETDMGYQLFPVTFPNALFAVLPVIITGEGVSLSDSFANVYGPTTSKFGLIYGSASTGTRSIGAYWVALGR